jgi:hypothetical protein
VGPNSGKLALVKLEMGGTLEIVLLIVIKNRLNLFY